MALEKEEREYFNEMFQEISNRFDKVDSDIKYLNTKIDQTKTDLIEEINKSDRMHYEDLETVMDDVEDHGIRIAKLEKLQTRAV